MDTAEIQVAGTVLEGLEVIIRRSDNGEYHWTAWAKNGRKVAYTGETYVNEDHAARMAMELFPTASVKNERNEQFRVEAK